MLSRRGKNNPVLIGEAGVGKTAIVEGLAQRIVDEDVPQTLAGKRVVQLELTGVVAGTRYRGDFEERVKRHRRDPRAPGRADHLHRRAAHPGRGGRGRRGRADAGNMLKPALARGELHIVGATTLDEYRKNIEKDAALARRFQPVLVPEPTVDDTMRSCAACATATRPTTRCASPTRRWWPRRSCPTATSPTGSCPTRRST